MYCQVLGASFITLFFSLSKYKKTSSQERKKQAVQCLPPKVKLHYLFRGNHSRTWSYTSRQKNKKSIYFHFFLFFCLNYNIRSNLSSAKNVSKLSEVTNRQCNNLLKAGNKSGRVSFGWMVPALTARTGRLPSELLSRLSWLPVPQSAAT